MSKLSKMIADEAIGEISMRELSKMIVDEAREDMGERLELLVVGKKYIDPKLLDKMISPENRKHLEEQAKNLELCNTLDEIFSQAKKFIIDNGEIINYDSSNIYFEYDEDVWFINRWGYFSISSELRDNFGAKDLIRGKFRIQVTYWAESSKKFSSIGAYDGWTKIEVLPRDYSNNS